MIRRSFSNNLVESQCFSGSALDWPHFKQRFLADTYELVSDYGISLDMLLTSCHGAAFEAIKWVTAIPDRELALNTALQVLEDDFGNAHRVAREHINKLHDMHDIEPTDVAMQTFLTHLRNCRMVILQNGSLLDLDQESNLFPIFQKLPLYLQRKYSQRILKKNNGNPSFDILTALIKEEKDRLSSCVGAWGLESSNSGHGKAASLPGVANQRSFNIGSRIKLANTVTRTLSSSVPEPLLATESFLSQTPVLSSPPLSRDTSLRRGPHCSRDPFLPDRGSCGTHATVASSSGFRAVPITTSSGGTTPRVRGTLHGPPTLDQAKPESSLAICVLCKQPVHGSLADCEAFQSSLVPRRWQAVTLERRCFICLNRGHQRYRCSTRRACGEHGCLELHHPLLHGHKEGQPRSVNSYCLSPFHALSYVCLSPLSGSLTQRSDGILIRMRFLILLPRATSAA